jgi:aconitase B
MGGLDKQMQEIVELLNSATPEQRNAVETLLRSRIKPE